MKKRKVFLSTLIMLLVASFMTLPTASYARNSHANPCMPGELWDHAKDGTAVCNYIDNFPTPHVFKPEHQPK